MGPFTGSAVEHPVADKFQPISMSRIGWLAAAWTPPAASPEDETNHGPGSAEHLHRLLQH